MKFMASSLLLFAFAGAGAASAQDQPAPTSLQLADRLRTAVEPSDKCKSSDPKTVVVCGHSSDRYRIDPAVLAATRAAEAPPKPALDASSVNPCTGAQCGGGMIPLVAMALTAVKAAELAANGDDWREAFRTHPDQYRLYQQMQAKEATKRHVSIGITAGSQPRP